jgi:hypothetical protein
MSMNQEPLERSIITIPEARLEWTTTGKWDMYLLYDQADYSQSSTSDGWWHRTLMLHPHHWLRLSGVGTIEPWYALQFILAQPHHPPIAFPPLLVALFLAHSPNPAALGQRQAFQWVAYAVREMLPVLSTPGPEAEWNEVLPHQLDQLSTAILNALLHPVPILPWPQSDGVKVQVLTRIADILWIFPPTLTRQISEVVGAYFQQRLEGDGQWLEDEESSFEDDDPISITRWSLLGNLGTMRFWREPWPTLRGLSIQAPMHEILFTWYQALVIMHPDAPIIDDTDLTWLCDGVLGAPYDAPFSRLFAACAAIETLNISVTGLYERILVVQQEAAQGSYLPRGRWELLVPAEWPVFWSYGAAIVRLIVGEDGCWVRLIPAQSSWGCVLWWRPHSDPPTCWTLAFADDVTSLCLLGLHATLWSLWRDLRVHGQPIGVNGAGHP